MKIYISGPITIDPTHWREHFADAEEYLHKQYPEATIINPLKLEDDPAYIEAQANLDGTDLYNWVMRRDIKLVCECSHIYALKGWERSPGARLEVNVGTTLGCNVLFEI